VHTKYVLMTSPKTVHDPVWSRPGCKSLQ